MVNRRIKMNEKLLIIAKDYYNKTEEVKGLMLHVLGQKTIKDLVSFGSRMPTGTFYYDGKKHTFTFHGIGCRFSNEYLLNVPISERKEKCLNIDMEMCGINPWMLFKFIEEYYPDSVIIFTAEAIKKEFDIAVKEKIMRKEKELNLYHFN